tara:strand:- start:8 stop:229 length:222 start_codon:yes stop_codon:yes gene_type:complete
MENIDNHLLYKEYNEDMSEGKRNVQVNVRMTKEDVELVKAKAKLEHMTFSEYMRLTALTAKITVVAERELDNS